MKSFKYVLLGGGTASGYAAREFVQRGVEPGQLCIITSEAVVAYERPALSKGFLLADKPARLPGFHTCVGKGWERQTPEWYAEHGIEYMTSTRVVSADIAGKKLVLDSGEEVGYEKLIVATGARPATLRELGVPGAELEGIHYVREVAEAQALYDAIADCKARSARAVVIGAGYIGMEVAAALAGNGLAVTMVFPGGMLMERLLPPEAASFYEEYYKERGVEVMWGQRGAGFEGEEGRLEAVLLQDGRRIEAGMAVVGIGARVNKELFEGQLDMAKGGIEVDGRLRTSNPDVYAIGDVAAFPLVGYGGQLQRQEHVTNARLSAAHAVSAIMAPEETGDYEYLPFFYSRFFALSWQFYGTNKGKSVMFGDKGAAKFGMYWLAEGRVVGAFLEGGSAEEFGWIKAVALRRPEAPATEERLAAKGLAFAAAVAAQEA